MVTDTCVRVHISARAGSGAKILDSSLIYSREEVLESSVYDSSLSLFVLCTCLYTLVARIYSGDVRKRERVVEVAGNAHYLSIEEMFPDHGGVDRRGILNGQKSKAARPAASVADRASFDFAKLGKVVPQSLYEIMTLAPECAGGQTA